MLPLLLFVLCQAQPRFYHPKLKLEHPSVFLIQVPVRSCRLVVVVSVVASVLVLGGEGSLGLVTNTGLALRLDIPLNPDLHLATRLSLRRLGVGHSLVGARLVKDIQVVSLVGDLGCRDRVELAGRSLGASGEAEEEALAGGVLGAELLAGLGGRGSWGGKGLDFGGGSGGGGDVALLGAGVEGLGEDGGGH